MSHHKSSPYEPDHAEKPEKTDVHGEPVTDLSGEPVEKTAAEPAPEPEPVPEPEPDATE